MSCAEPIVNDCGAVLPKASLVRSLLVALHHLPSLQFLRRYNAPNMLAIGSYAMPCLSSQAKE